MLAEARRNYDHRIRAAVVATGNLHLFPKLNIPESTTRTWVRRGARRVVAAANDEPAEDFAALHDEIAALRAKARTYFAIAAVLLVAFRVLATPVDSTRIPDARSKALLLRAITLAANTVPLRRLLRLVGLSASRFHSWKRREVRCELDDRPSCPNSQPLRLTGGEIGAIKSLVLDPRLRHMSVRALSLLAQRTRLVFVSATTWRRLIKQRGWCRPRTRLYPARPKIGIRATTPNEWWHVDLTVIRLLSGRKLYLHAIIDNFSRRILAWELADRITTSATTSMLQSASRFLDGTPVNLMTDGGGENINGEVDDYLASSPIRRILAQVDVAESNSMIEAFWRSLRHQWLYLHELDSIETVRALVEFYVNQHNRVMPHAAFDGQTPNEMFFGSAPSCRQELEERRAEARAERVAANKSNRCPACPSVALEGAAAVRAVARS